MSEIKFPPSCVVCQAPAAGTYDVHQVYTVGRKSKNITLPVPMCSTHTEAAHYKSLLEKVMTILMTIASAFVGLLAMFILIWRWVPNGHDSLLLKLALGGFFGICVFGMAWAVGALWIAPMFADQDSKQARQAVQIVLVRPFDNALRLRFTNDLAADRVQTANQQSIT